MVEREAVDPTRRIRAQGADARLHHRLSPRDHLGGEMIHRAVAGYEPIRERAALDRERIVLAVTERLCLSAVHRTLLRAVPAIGPHGVSRRVLAGLDCPDARNMGAYVRERQGAAASTVTGASLSSMAGIATRDAAVAARLAFTANLAASAGNSIAAGRTTHRKRKRERKQTEKPLHRRPPGRGDSWRIFVARVEALVRF